MNQPSRDLLWWVLPGVLAGMPMPLVHPGRRLQRDGSVHQFPDDLPVLYAAGIRSVVSLLNNSSDAPAYEAAGFSFLASAVPDYQPPTMSQAIQIVEFIRAAPKAVAVHCECGIGRTGTLIAAFLIRQGASAEEAIRQVRGAQPAAIESRAQVSFLHEFDNFRSARGAAGLSSSPPIVSTG